MNANSKSNSKGKTVKAVRENAAVIEQVSDASAKALAYAGALAAYRAGIAGDASIKSQQKSAGIIRTFASMIGSRLIDGAVINRDAGLKVARIGAALATRTGYIAAAEKLNASARGSVDASVPFFICSLLAAGESGQTRKAAVLNAQQSLRYKDASGAQMNYARQGLQALGIVSDAKRNGSCTIIDMDAALALLPDGALETVLSALTAETAQTTIA